MCSICNRAFSLLGLVWLDDEDWVSHIPIQPFYFLSQKASGSGGRLVTAGHWNNCGYCTQRGREGAEQLVKKCQLAVLHEISYTMILQDNRGFTLKSCHTLIELKAIHISMLISMEMYGHKVLEKDCFLHIIIWECAILQCTKWGWDRNVYSKVLTNLYFPSWRHLSVSSFSVPCHSEHFTTQTL